MAAAGRVVGRKTGLLPDELLRITDDPRQDMARGALVQLALKAQADKRFVDATAAMVWVHTLRALCFPEIRYLGREMWRQLERGREHLLPALEAADASPDVYVETARIVPEDLNPDDTPPTG
jgi:hypothetical protein